MNILQTEITQVGPSEKKKAQLMNSHGDSEELVSGGGDDHVGLTQDPQIVLFTGQETPVQDVTVQQASSLRENLCRITGREEEEAYRWDGSGQVSSSPLISTKKFSGIYYKSNDCILIRKCRFILLLQTAEQEGSTLLQIWRSRINWKTIHN